MSKYLQWNFLPLSWVFFWAFLLPLLYLYRYTVWENALQAQPFGEENAGAHLHLGQKRPKRSFPCLSAVHSYYRISRWVSSTSTCSCSVKNSNVLSSRVILIMYHLNFLLYSLSKTIHYLSFLNVQFIYKIVTNNNTSLPHKHKCQIGGTLEPMIIISALLFACKS